jgi:hypothetical protein
MAEPAEWLAGWSERLSRAALSEVDRRAVALSESARANVLDRMGDHGQDTLHAWGALGRVLASAGASPTLVAHTVSALSSAGEELETARAALFEAYMSAQRELAEARIADSWRFPRCVVRLGERKAAVAAFFPDDDSEATARWADEVASGLAKMGVRSVHVEGHPHARTALRDALATFDIPITAPSAD